MPHAAPPIVERPSFSQGRPPPVKIPSSSPVRGPHEQLLPFPEISNGIAPPKSSSPHQYNSHPNGALPSDRWQARRQSTTNRGFEPSAGTRHGRQKSLSDAINTIRTRRASVSANAHEIADALKAPVSPKLITLCLIWYLTSALTNTSSKSILNAFPKPVTLTLIQFAFVSSWCIFFAYLARIYPSLRRAIPALQHGIRPPSREVVSTTLPLAAFQIGGHLLSSTATSKIPVSLVHTIKGLSPLFTVLAYRLFFRIHYSLTTYLSLIPLTLGVMLACSAEFSGHFFGVLCAFGGAIIFVTQNIFSKKLFNEAARAEADGQQQQSRKLDKLNLLCYSSGLAFILTGPLWLWSEGFGLIGDFFHDGALDLSGKKDALGSGRLTLEFLFNGTFHFGQNIMAFVLLSMVSPVTYSVASLVKRIFVIVVAIVWFGNSTTPVQAVGIALTFLGLYLYDRTSDAARGDRRARLDQLKTSEPLLPLQEHRATPGSAVFLESPASATSGQLYGGGGGFPNGVGAGPDDKKTDVAGPGGRPRGASNAPTASWLPPGTRQEETWRPRDMLPPKANGLSVS
ncbi:MAG: suppressor of loss of ypt1 [Thelocarpon impressellum]|nr:MAG: suppressor of loss of ypt1 [Thelocarpon impressellum]